MASLPEVLHPLFWDTDFSTLDWETDQDWIIRRILQVGSWQAIRWLRSTLGDEALRMWIEGHNGGRMSPRQLRYWELVLNLPEQDVDRWILHAQKGPWEGRIQA